MNYLTFRLWHKDCWSTPSTKPPVGNVEIIHSYGRTVKELLSYAFFFGFDGVLFLEHDIEFPPTTFKRIREFLVSRHPLLESIYAFPYLLFPISTGLPKKVIAHRIRTVSPVGDISYRWMEPKDFRYSDGNFNYAEVDTFGMGCTFLPSSLRVYINQSWDYPSFDTELSFGLINHRREFGNRHSILVPEIWVEHTHIGYMIEG